VAAWPIDADFDTAAAGDLSDSGGHVIALQWTKVKLDAVRTEGKVNVVAKGSRV